MTIKFKQSDKIVKLPNFCIFDTDNTLYAYEKPHREAMKAVGSKVSRLLGTSKQDFEDTFSLAREEIRKRLGDTASSHSRLLYFQRTVEMLGFRTQVLTTLDLEQTYWRTFLTNAALFPGVRECLLEMRSKGTRCLVITDLTSQIQYRKLIYFGLDNFFDFVITSEEAGKDKPDSAPFLLAKAKAGINEDHTVWMIGDDTETDILGARKHLGAITLQKNHFGVTVGTGKDAPDVVFDNFKEIVALLSQRQR
jgi:putative hydrolase of the HAD superfamily